MKIHVFKGIAGIGVAVVGGGGVAMVIHGATTGVSVGGVC